MRWRVKSAAQQLPREGIDAIRWAYDLENDDGRQTRVIVAVSGTAMAVRTVESETADVIETQGRSAVERVLDWADPPQVIRFFSHGGAQYDGGSPGEPSQTSSVDQLDAWFAAQGLRLSLQQGNAGWTFEVIDGNGIDILDSRLTATTREEAAQLARELTEVREAQQWFSDRGYELLLHQPGGRDNGWFAPFIRQGSSGGSAPYGWGRTRSEAVSDAQRQYLERERVRA